MWDASQLPRDGLPALPVKLFRDGSSVLEPKPRHLPVGHSHPLPRLTRDAHLCEAAVASLITSLITEA